MITTIAFDGDDTLWHNERAFAVTQEKFRSVLAHYAPQGDIYGRLYETEVRNLRLFGYGVKGFTLSMIETAIELTEGRIDARDIRTLLSLDKEMLEHPVELLPDVPATIERLKDRYRLMVITKGDLFDQESKLARSGLAEHFWRIEIVSEKDQACYRAILDRHGIAAQNFLLVGNSVRSDILPVLAIGARAVHVPHPLVWQHEVATPDEGTDFPVLGSVGELERLLAELEAGTAA